MRSEEEAAFSLGHLGKPREAVLELNVTLVSGHLDALESWVVDHIERYRVLLELDRCLLNFLWL